MRVQCAPLSMLPIYSALPSDLQAKIFQSAPAVTASVLVRPSAVAASYRLRGFRLAWLSAVIAARRSAVPCHFLFGYEVNRFLLRCSGSMEISRSGYRPQWYE